MKEIHRCLLQLNSIFKENDEIYRCAAKTAGLSDCAFWILYSLREDGNSGLTQSELCHTIYLPKQTINSALKKLEGSGYLELTSADDHRSKQIRLTEKGIALADKTVDRVIGLEHNALSGLSRDEQQTFLKLFQKYTDLLKENMKEL